MAEESVDNIMMIGPTQAGKTTLLSVLRLAALRKLKNGRSVKIKPVNETARKLFELPLDIGENGNIPVQATNDPVSIDFQLICEVDKRVRVEHYEEVPGWWKSTKVDKSYYKIDKELKTFNLQVIDGKGGDIFGRTGGLGDNDADKKRRARLVEMAAQSTALVVCVNSGDPKATGDFFKGLQKFFDDIHSSGRPIPFKRIAIALTQADRLVEQFGSSAFARLQELDPAAEASKTLGFYARSNLFQALEPSARKWVYACWVSVYGFIPNEGSVNFDSANNRTVVFRENDAKWTDDWIPFGVIEPFLFACTGEVNGLKQLAEPTE